LVDVGEAGIQQNFQNKNRTASNQKAQQLGWAFWLEYKGLLKLSYDLMICHANLWVKKAV
jgi:hypothetical protein